MGVLLEALKARFGAKADYPQPTGGGNWFHASPLMFERNYRSDIGDGSLNSIVTASVRWVQRTFPEARPYVRTRVQGQWEEVANDPAIGLIRWPNPSYSGSLLWWGTLASWMIDGNAYWLKLRSGVGRPSQLWWVPSHLIEPKFPSDGSRYLDFYEYTPGGGRRFEVPPEEVVHYRHGLDPMNTRKGVSDLKTLLREIYTDEEASRFTAALLRNMGVPGMIVSPASTDPQAGWDDDERDAAKLKLMQSTTGDHRGEPHIFSTAAKIETYGFSPEQLDLGRIRSIPEGRITAVMGIPSAVLGLNTGMDQTKVGATMAELRELAFESVIVPMQNLMADELKTQLLVDFYSDRDHEVAWDLSDVRVLQEDENRKAERIVRLTGGPVMTRAEGRREFGLDVTPNDDVLYLPISVTEVREDGQQPETAPQSASLALPEGKGATKADATRAELRAAAAIARGIAPLQSAFARDVEKRLTAYGKLVAQQYLSRAPKALSQEEADIVSSILAEIAANEWRNANLGPLYQKLYAGVGSVVYSTFNGVFDLGLGVNLPDPIETMILRDGGTQLGLLDMEQETRSALMRIIEKGRTDGLNPLNIARQIRDQVPAGPFVNAGSSYRAEMIARTETRNAQASATIAVGHTAGFEEYIVFDGRLGSTDAECEAMDGRIVSASEVASIMANEHPNGTRSCLPRPRSEVRALTAGVEAPMILPSGKGYHCPDCGKRLPIAEVNGTVHVFCSRCKAVKQIGGGVVVSRKRVERDEQGFITAVIEEEV